MEGSDPFRKGSDPFENYGAEDGSISGSGAGSAGSVAGGSEDSEVSGDSEVSDGSEDSEDSGVSDGFGSGVIASWVVVPLPDDGWLLEEPPVSPAGG